MHRLILLAAVLDQFEILGERVGRGGWFDGLGDYEYEHLLPMLFDECGVELMLSPVMSAVFVMSEGVSAYLADVLLHCSHLDLFLTTFLKILRTIDSHWYPPDCEQIGTKKGGRWSTYEVGSGFSLVAISHN